MVWFDRSGKEIAKIGSSETATPGVPVDFTRLPPCGSAAIDWREYRHMADRTRTRPGYPIHVGSCAGYRPDLVSRRPADRVQFPREGRRIRSLPEARYGHGKSGTSNIRTG